jgi:hypothetical protein
MIERREQLARATEVGRLETSERHERAVVAAVDVGDTPTEAAGNHPIADANTWLQLLHDCSGRLSAGTAWPGATCNEESVG